MKIHFDLKRITRSPPPRLFLVTFPPTVVDANRLQAVTGSCLGILPHPAPKRRRSPFVLERKKSRLVGLPPSRANKGPTNLVAPLTKAKAIRRARLRAPICFGPSPTPARRCSVSSSKPARQKIDPVTVEGPISQDPLIRRPLAWAPFPPFPPLFPRRFPPRPAPAPFSPALGATSFSRSAAVGWGSPQNRQPACSIRSALPSHPPRSPFLIDFIVVSGGSPPPPPARGIPPLAAHRHKTKKGKHGGSPLHFRIFFSFSPGRRRATLGHWAAAPDFRL